MSNLFGILAALLLAATAFLAYKNKDAFQQQVNDRVSEQGKLASAKVRLKDTTKDRDDTLASLSAQEEKNTALKADVEKQIAVNEEIKSRVADQKEVAVAKKAEVEENKGTLDSLGEVPELIANMKREKEISAELLTQNAAADAQIVALEKNKNASATVISDRNSTVSGYISKRSSAKLKSKVTRVMHQWGFVTVAGGDAAGIVKDSTLDVLRNGEKVAELLVTAVEANTAGASIVPTEAGLPDIYPGDVVVASLAAAAPTSPTASAQTPVATSVEKVEEVEEPAEPEVNMEEQGADLFE